MKTGIEINPEATLGETSASSQSSYPYSFDLQRLLDFGAKIKIHPVYVIGLDREQLHALRNSYLNPGSNIRVGIYGIYDTSALLERVGLEPTLMILAEHVRIDGDLAVFTRRFRTPILRLMHYPVHLHNLCHEDYYGGVYETLASSDVTNTEAITYMINLGILIWLRNRGERTAVQQRLASALDLSGAENREIDPRASSMIRKQVSVPKPESSWEVYAKKQLEGFVPGPSYAESVKSIDDHFKQTDSEFELNLDA